MLPSIVTCGVNQCRQRRQRLNDEHIRIWIPTSQQRIRIDEIRVAVGNVEHESKPARPAAAQLTMVITCRSEPGPLSAVFVTVATIGDGGHGIQRRGRSSPTRGEFGETEIVPLLADYGGRRIGQKVREIRSIQPVIGHRPLAAIRRRYSRCSRGVNWSSDLALRQQPPWKNATSSIPPRKRKPVSFVQPPMRAADVTTRVVLVVPKLLSQRLAAAVDIQ